MVVGFGPIKRIVTEIHFPFNSGGMGGFTSFLVFFFGGARGIQGFCSSIVLVGFRNRWIRASQDSWWVVWYIV